MKVNTYKVAVVGGGINGLTTAWFLAKQGYEVHLFEQDRVLSHTSSASTKLLHGGLRYLEFFDIKQVLDGIKSRTWWFDNVPEFAKEIEINIPIFKHSTRSRLKIKIGLLFYDFLANGRISKHRYISKKQMLRENPDLKEDGLLGGFTYYDGQMDEVNLGEWVRRKAQESGVKIFERTFVKSLDVHGNIYFENGTKSDFDKIFNIAGPWAEQLLQRSNIEIDFKVKLVRGSHILLDKPIEKGYYFEALKDKRPFFVIPYKGKTLIGTTEIPHDIEQDSISCDEKEKEYLLNSYKEYLTENADFTELTTFSGVRTLVVKKEASTSFSSREFAIQENGAIASVFGGKWTTSRLLAETIVKHCKVMKV